MRYRTELMQQILTNAKAQEIIDYVSQIYGNSYVGLWIFQVIGTVLEPICNLADQLQKETSPATTELLISYYEQEYGIQTDPAMSLTQRRAAVIAARRSKGACNPARLADAVSAALGGVEVEIIEYDGTSIGETEIDSIIIDGGLTKDGPGPIAITPEEINNLVILGQDIGDETGKGIATDEIDSIIIYQQAARPSGTMLAPKFIVNIRDSVDSVAPAISAVEQMKPAELIYTIQGVTKEETESGISVGMATTLAELFTVTVWNKVVEVYAADGTEPYSPDWLWSEESWGEGVPVPVSAGIADEETLYEVVGNLTEDDEFTDQNKGFYIWDGKNWRKIR